MNLVCKLNEFAELCKLKRLQTAYYQGITVTSKALQNEWFLRGITKFEDGIAIGF